MNIGDMGCPPVDLVDKITRGDRVSWKSVNGTRHFGRVTRVTTRDFKPAYAVTGDDGNGYIVAARDITKEVG